MAEISVKLIDHMGSDLSVCNAARVSFDKESNWEVACTADCRQHGWMPDAGCSTCEIIGLSERDTKLIQFLARENHWSPFAHCYASFRVHAPIFVARQLQKHTVGLAWNEVSRRYVDTEPTFYSPQSWRKRAENVKQGSSDETTGNWGFGIYGAAITKALDVYEDMIAYGVCPEQARMVLPQSMMTEWIWSGSLYAFARVCNLRLDSHAQRETQTVAKGISDHMTKLFPVSWSVLVDTKEH